MTYRFPVLSLALAVALTAAPVLAQAPSTEPPAVTASGEGAVSAVPDRMRSLGVPADAIRTTQVNLFIDVDYVNGKRVTRGYVLTHAVDVRIDALDRVGEILDAAVAAGATALGEIRFDVKGRAALEREALKLAVQDARARAEAMAAGAGRSLDRVLRIEEHGVPAPMPMPVRAMALKEAAGADTPVAAGQLEFRARVTLTATLK